MWVTPRRELVWVLDLVARKPFAPGVREAFGLQQSPVRIGTTGSASRCHCQAFLMTHDFQRYSRSGRDRPLPLL